MVMKAEVIRTGEGTVMVISQRSPHNTDENNHNVYKNVEGPRFRQPGTSLIPLKCSSHNFNGLYRSNVKSWTVGHA
jgi:hypothetical protein